MTLQKKTLTMSLSIKLGIGVLMSIAGISGAYAIYTDAEMGSIVTSGNQFTSEMWNAAVGNIRDIYTRTQYINTSGVNTGIGTATPGTKLDVTGVIRGSSYGAFSQGIVTGVTGAVDGKIFSPSGTYIGASTWGINYNEGSPDYIEFNNASGPTSRIALDDGSAHFGLGGGNVGIGTGTPSQKLDVSGTVRANSFLGGRLATETNGLRISNPDGGSMATAASTMTGAIKIKLPVTSFKSNTMIRFTIKIYEYAGGGAGTARTIEVGGYNYSDAAANWINYFATQSTMGGSDINVRFGNDGTSQAVWIGETGTVWSYPQVFVTDFQGGYSNATDAKWGSGWNISVQPAFDTVTQGPIVARKDISSSSLAGTTGYMPKFTGTNTLGNSQVFDNGTNVGIGTATPAYKLDVTGDLQANGWLRTVGDRGWYSQTWGGGFYMSDATWIRIYGGKSFWAESGTIGTNGSLSIGYGGTTGPAGGAILAGNVGIGNSAPTRKLDVTGEIGSSGGYFLRNTSPTIYFQDTDNRSAMIHNNGNLLYFLRGCGNNSVTWCQTGGYWPLTINLENNDAVFGGNIYGFNYFYNSDKRFKKNIVPLKDSLNKILQLNGYTYEWKKNGEEAVGVIAQEVEKVFPQLVGESKNAEGESYKSVQYGNLVAPLIESTKELASMHNEQEEKLEKLEKENEALKKQILSIEKRLTTLGK